MRARGDRGMLPADLRRPWRSLCPGSLGPRPCKVLGRIWPEPAGELGALELGELLWEELPPTNQTKSISSRTYKQTQINSHHHNKGECPPDNGKSGAGRKEAVGERGDRLWVGEPGRLSPDEREWFRDEKLRLVCRRGEGCIAKRLNRERRLKVIQKKNIIIRNGEILCQLTLLKFVLCFTNHFVP